MAGSMASVKLVDEKNELSGEETLIRFSPDTVLSQKLWKAHDLQTIFYRKFTLSFAFTDTFRAMLDT
jgi:hypothetical protein